MRSLTTLTTLAASALVLAACDREPNETSAAEIRDGAGVEITTASTPTPPAGDPVVVERVAPAPASYEASEAAFRDRRFDDARRGFEAYVGREPGNAWGWYMLGLSTWKAGDAEAALVAFDSALARDPGHLKSLHNSARALLDAGRPDEAAERARTAIATDAGDVEAHRLLGRALHSTGDMAGAEAAYRSALVLDGTDLWSLNNLGVVYLDQGKLDEAIGPLARAVELEAGSPVFLNNLGSTLERLGDLGGARFAYERALEADSGYAKAQVSLARVNERITGETRPTVDLAERAQQFVIGLRVWADRREGAEVMPDSVSGTGQDL